MAETGAAKNPERTAINALLAEQNHLGKLNESARSALGELDGEAFGSWLFASGQCQIRILERCFDLVDTWSPLQPSLPKGAEAEREHLIAAVESVRNRAALLERARSIVSEREALKSRLAADTNMDDQTLATSALDNQSALVSLGSGVFGAVDLFSRRVAELNARLSMDALQIAAEQNGLSTTAIPESRRDDGSWSMGVSINFEREPPEKKWWRFWRR